MATEVGQAFDNCTLYFKGGFGYVRMPCKWVKVNLAPYAQYQNAVHIEYLQKGKRKPQGFVQTYKPSVVVAAGQDTPEPPSFFLPTEVDGAVSVARARHSSCSEGWQGDFESETLPQLEVLANFHGHNSTSKF